jgi:hypothetical protein
MPDPLRVVYVVGSSHSGSTLLAMLADEHPDVASVGETAIKPRIRREGRAATQPCSCGSTVHDCPFWQSIFYRVRLQDVHLDGSSWTNDYRFEDRWLDALLTRETSSQILLWLRRRVPGLVPAYRARIARIDRVNVAFIDAVLSHRSASVFLDGTKLLTRLVHLLQIPELNVKIVRLVRDVRGFAASAKSRGLSTVEAAQVWHKDQRAIARVLQTLPAESTLLMRYEDLCAEPGPTLQRLWAFCGVRPFEAPSSVQASDHHILGNRMRMEDTITIRLDESWRTRLTPIEHRDVLTVAGAMNRSMGYA